MVTYFFVERTCTFINFNEVSGIVYLLLKRGGILGILMGKKERGEVRGLREGEREECKRKGREGKG